MTFNTLGDLICGLPGLAAVLKSSLKSSTDLRLENAALRAQIQMLEDKLKRLGSKRHASRPIDRRQEHLCRHTRLSHPAIRQLHQTLPAVEEIWIGQKQPYPWVGFGFPVFSFTRLHAAWLLGMILGGLEQTLVEYVF